jgi:hypothetical protein
MASESSTSRRKRKGISRLWRKDPAVEADASPDADTDAADTPEADAASEESA